MKDKTDNERPATERMDSSSHIPKAGRPGAAVLQNSDEHFRTIFDSVNDAIFIHDLETGAVVDVNKRMLEMYGFTREEALCLRATDVSSGEPPYAEEDTMRWIRKGATGEPQFFEWHAKHKTGRLFWVEVNMRRAAIGETEHLLVTVRDVTERKKAEEALKESESRLRVILESIQAGILIVDPETHRIVYVNPVALKLIGVPEKEIVGSVCHEFICAAEKGKCPITDLGQTLDNSERALLTAKGGRIPIIKTVSYVTLDGRRHLLESFIDITHRAQAEEEKARLESQLRQSQKMEAIGTLAGGIAHDFNNILTAIIGYGSLLQMGMENDPKKQYVNQILASSQKAATLTQSLLAFSRKQAIDPKPCKVNEIIHEAGKLLKRLLTEDIEFTVVHSASDMTIEADVTQMDQVLMNLAGNARDAMPEGGKLIIETKAVCLDKDFVQVHGFGKPGDYALISVTDTGIGMDREIRRKIFEPFFTTKEVGKGTGLGLSIVYGIIKQHNGYIGVLSEPNQGTRFDMYFPISKTPVEETKQLYKYVRGGSETILVAEDNGDVRRLTKEVLSNKGYTIIETTDGDDAVRKFMKHKDEIALLVLDVVMPKKNGKEAYEEILKIKPDAKALFTSGYTGDVILAKGPRDGAIHYISKPLVPNELLSKVREVLDRAP